MFHWPNKTKNKTGFRIKIFPTLYSKGRSKGDQRAKFGPRKISMLSVDEKQIAHAD